MEFILKFCTIKTLSQIKKTYTKIKKQHKTFKQ